MNSHTLVLKELWQRKTELVTSCAAVALGIAVIVAVRTMTVSSRNALREQMHQLGANMLVVPKSAEVSDYYLADLMSDDMPEEHAHTLNASEMAAKVHNMVAKLSSRVRIGNVDAILTGVLPKTELRHRPKWRTGGLFSPEHEEAPAEDPPPESPDHEDHEPGREAGAIQARLTVDSLRLSHVLVGSEVARLTGATAASTISIRGKSFWVEQVLKPTGTVDDVRVHAHLHTVQELLGKPGLINVIEIVGCGCKTDLRRLGKKIETLLPGTRVLTIRHIERTQVGVVRTMEGFALVFLLVVVPIGGGAIANYAAGNVRERRRELGTLLALGARPRFIVRLFLEKAVLIGLVGGAIGYVVGTALAAKLGPYLWHVAVVPLPGLIGWAVALAVALSLVFSALPAWRAMKLDPATLLEED